MNGIIPNPTALLVGLEVVVFVVTVATGTVVAAEGAIADVILTEATYLLLLFTVIELVKKEA